jgi:hypothetical protein
MSDQWLRAGGAAWLDSLLYDTEQMDGEPLLSVEQDWHKDRADNLANTKRQA